LHGGEFLTCAAIPKQHEGGLRKLLGEAVSVLVLREHKQSLALHRVGFAVADEPILGRTHWTPPRDACTRSLIHPVISESSHATLRAPNLTGFGNSPREIIA
jgi:hypothetical protein